MESTLVESMEGGFKNPVFDAQKTFDTVMNAMARPGTVKSLAPMASAPCPVFKTSAAIMMTLCDNDTPVWLERALASRNDLANWLAFHTGAPTVVDHSDAQFAYTSNFDSLPDLASFAQGSQEYPDRSTTLIVQVDTLATEHNLILTGPGIQSQSSVSIGDIPTTFLNQWQLNTQRFPRGVDIIFASPTSVMCLPRTTKIVQRSA